MPTGHRTRVNQAEEKYRKIYKEYVGQEGALKKGESKLIRY
jgi:hypothetical protein